MQCHLLQYNWLRSLGVILLLIDKGTRVIRFCTLWFFSDQTADTRCKSISYPEVSISFKSQDQSDIL
jgi:hypothetical protein